MSNLITLLRMELLKLRRARIFSITVGVFAFFPLMTALVMYIAMHPELSESLGIVGAKAAFVGEISWSGLFSLVMQGLAGLGMVGFGFVTGYVFGREHSDHTLKDLLVLPVSRAKVVTAKFLAVALWCAALTAVTYLSALLSGLLLGLPGASPGVLLGLNGKLFLLGGLTLLLCTPVAFMASWTRGVLAPAGFAVLTVIVSNFAAMIGLGAFFPWTVPALLTLPGMSPDGIAAPLILIATSLVGLWATRRHWRVADHV